jgi:hypothetical protein
MAASFRRRGVGGERCGGRLGWQMALPTQSVMIAEQVFDSPSEGRPRSL